MRNRISGEAAVLVLLALACWSVGASDAVAQQLSWWQGTVHFESFRSIDAVGERVFVSLPIMPHSETGRLRLDLGAHRVGGTEAVYVGPEVAVAWERSLTRRLGLAPFVRFAYGRLTTVVDSGGYDYVTPSGEAGHRAFRRPARVSAPSAIMGLRASVRVAGPIALAATAGYGLVGGPDGAPRPDGLFGGIGVRVGWNGAGRRGPPRPLVPSLPAIATVRVPFELPPAVSEWPRLDVSAAPPEAAASLAREMAARPPAASDLRPTRVAARSRARGAPPAPEPVAVAPVDPSARLAVSNARPPDPPSSSDPAPEDEPAAPLWLWIPLGIGSLGTAGFILLRLRAG